LFDLATPVIQVAEQIGPTHVRLEWFIANESDYSLNRYAIQLVENGNMDAIKDWPGNITLFFKTKTYLLVSCKY
jgi:hypothetical protein